MNWLAIILFLAVVMGVSLYAFWRSRIIKTDSADGYFMGGNSLTGFTIASTIIMTNLSTEQIVGQNGQSYGKGMEVMAWEVTAASCCSSCLTCMDILTKVFKVRCGYHF